MWTPCWCVSRFRLRREHAPLAALVALAAALRIPGLGYGLPFSLLNPDEQSIVPRAWEIVHGGGLDPAWYDYPSLLFYVLAPFQALADEPSYGAARAVAAVFGIGGVAAAWWLGRSAYGALAGLAAGAAVAVAGVHVAYSHMAVTDVLLTLLVTVGLALLVHGRLEWAAAAAGLAASAKYPGILVAVPIAAVGWGQWRRLGIAALAAAAAFALTSPFVLVHPGRAWDDVSRVQRLAREGWLGFEGDGPAPVAFFHRLWESLGPALVVALLGVALAARALVLNQHKLARSRLDPSLSSGRSAVPKEKVLIQHKVLAARADLALVGFGLVYFAYLATLGAHFDRYVLPLLPVLGALAGRSRRLAVATLVLLLVPLVWSIGDVRGLTRTDTRAVAARWLDANVPANATVAVDPSLAPVDAATVIRLELPGPGRPEDPRRDLARLRALGVDYLVLNGLVADRVLAAASRYPGAAALYLTAPRAAELVLDVEPGAGRRGPWVRVYRL